RLLPSDVRFVKFDLSLNVIDLDGEILLDFDYDSDLFEQATIDAWSEAFVDLVARCIDNPQTPLAALRWGRETNETIVDAEGCPVLIGVPGALRQDGAGTGLHARQRADGTVQILGLGDEEIWCGGERLRTGDVEAILATHPGVERARVRLRDDGTLGAQIATRGCCDATALRRFLTERVPPARVPAAFSCDSGAWFSGVRSAGGAAEAALLRIFRDVLKRDAIGADDDFFLLGGQSIQAVQIAMQVWRTLGVRLALNELFTYRTVASLASRVASGDAGDVAPILTGAPAASYEASHAQRRFWFLGQIAEQEVAYNLPGAYLFDGVVDAEALREAFRSLIERHEILRTTFATRDGRLRQIVHDDIGFTLDVDEIETDDVERLVRACIEQEAARPFDLARGPLLFARLLRVSCGGTRRDVLLYNVHHILCDGWSQVVMIRELTAAYEGVTLPPPRIQYRDYVAWNERQLESAAAQRSREFWIGKLSGDLTRLDLPADFPHPAVPGTRGRRLRFRIDAEMTAALGRLAGERGCTLFMLCVALLETPLQRYTNAEDIILGTPVAGRMHPDLQDQIGCYVNTLVLRNRLSASMSFAGILDAVRETVLEAFEHQDYPFDRLVEDLSIARDLRRSPLFDVLVTMQNNERIPFVLGGNEGRVIESDFTVTPFDLSIDFVEDGGEVAALVEYNAEIFGAARMERFAAHFLRLTREVLTDPLRPIGDIDLLLDSERAMLAAFNDTSMPFRQGRTLSDLFEEQAAKTPERIALVSEGRMLTYAELAARANALAGEVRQVPGVGADQRVALLIPRSEWTVVGMLGVLAAGAAYVPLDPEQPPRRLAEIVRHCGCKAIIAGDERSAALAREISVVPVLDVIPSAVTNPLPQRIARDERSLAYVIYTS
ncbi:MAG: amino acid adenylation domain protein, partial [Acidobacteria bacterium]|nr:amino acid adenylation domain protein [Acidobacteriota bacterium]